MKAFLTPTILAASVASGLLFSASVAAAPWVDACYSKESCVVLGDYVLSSLGRPWESAQIASGLKPDWVGAFLDDITIAGDIPFLGYFLHEVVIRFEAIPGCGCAGARPIGGSVAGPHHCGAWSSLDRSERAGGILRSYRSDGSGARSFARWSSRGEGAACIHFGARRHARRGG